VWEECHWIKLAQHPAAPTETNPLGCFIIYIHDGADELCERRRLELA
jgi:hypothetical protein